MYYISGNDVSIQPTIKPQNRVVPNMGPEIEVKPALHSMPLSKGVRNENPSDISLLALLAEDFHTYDRDFLEPAFWAVFWHRFGNARMSVSIKLLRAPLTLIYRLMYKTMILLWGIDLPYTTRLGRRGRIWHHGGLWLGAHSIGDDVHIRHNTTFGVLNRDNLDAKPIIGNRVDIGVGACVLGAVKVGDDSIIGPNSVVIRDLSPGSVVMGVPARQTALWKDESPSQVMSNAGGLRRGE